MLKKRYGSDSPRLPKVSFEKEKACLRVITLQSRKQREKEKFNRRNFNYTPSVSDVEDFWRGIVGSGGRYHLEDPTVKKGESTQLTMH